jgi:hypothetical protein
MPQYHFGIQTDRRFVDEQGIDLADHAAARAMAIQTCGELMRDGGATFWGTRPWKVTVSDEVGLMLFYNRSRRPRSDAYELALADYTAINYGE